MKKQLVPFFKSIGFVLLVHAFAVILTCLSFDFSEEHKMLTLICLGVALLIFIPSYFFVKGKAERPVLYLVVTAVSHIIAAIVANTVLNAIYSAPDWDNFYPLITEAAVGICFIVIVLLDIAVMICKRIVKYARK